MKRLTQMLYFIEGFEHGMDHGWNQIRTVRDKSNNVLSHLVGPGNDSKRMSGH